MRRLEGELAKKSMKMAKSVADYQKILELKDGPQQERELEAKLLAMTKVSPSCSALPLLGFCQDGETDSRVVGVCRRLRRRMLK